MDQELENYRVISLRLCEKLIQDLNRNQVEARSFFQGDIYEAYVKVTEKAIVKAEKTLRKIKNM
jgi:hypothetical protein